MKNNLSLIVSDMKISYNSTGIVYRNWVSS